MADKIKTVAPRVSLVVNETKTYDPANSHTHLVLHGDAADAPYPHVMSGTLRPTFRDHENSAAAFALSKIMVAAPVGTPLWTQTAASSEVLLPEAACDRFTDARLLMETLDEERPEKVNALLAYFTFTYPTDRLHAMREEVRAFLMKEIVERHDVATLLILHDPGRAASKNLPHVHALVTSRRLTALGFAEQVSALNSDKAQAMIRDAFLNYWTARR